MMALRSEAFEIKGWCPGALRPMPSGDGLVVRVRPMLGRLDVATLLALGEAAARFGNGQIDLTRRANLQIRGVASADLKPLQNLLRELGLLDADAASETVRNIMLSPLSGIDPAAHDVDGVAQDISRHLANDRALWQLPGKFGFVVDGGGACDLMTERADIRLAAITPESLALSIDRPAGTRWLGQVACADASDAAIAVAKMFLERTTAGGRMRDLGEADVDAIATGITPGLAALPHAPPRTMQTPRVGLHTFDHDHVAIGIAAPFGRLAPEQIRVLADVMTAKGVSAIRLSPWRVLFAQADHATSARRICDAAKAAGLIVDADDPLLQIEACPGAPSCEATRLDTRATARALAAQLPGSGFDGSIHVSGCAKGCARSAASDLVLVGNGDRYGLVRHGTARDVTSRQISPADLAHFEPFLLKAHA